MTVFEIPWLTMNYHGKNHWKPLTNMAMYGVAWLIMMVHCRPWSDFSWDVCKAVYSIQTVPPKDALDMKGGHCAGTRNVEIMHRTVIYQHEKEDSMSF